MKALCFLISLLISPLAVAQGSMSLSEWLDIFADSCVGAGSSAIVNGSVDADGKISLKKLRLNGAVTGQLDIPKSNYELLSDGISQKLKSVTKKHAKKVGNCFKPVSRSLLLAKNRQSHPAGPNATASMPIHFLSPYEERVMKFLAHARAGSGTGRQIPFANVVAGTGMSDIRLRAILKMLESKVLATDLVGVVSLYEPGDEYILEMGYAK